MTTLLLDESPLYVIPSLARELGTEDAVFLQQLHWLTKESGYAMDEDGERWIEASVHNLRERWFDFIPQRTLERIISDAKKSGFLITKRKRTGALYRVDAAKIRQIGGPSTADMADQHRQIGGTPCNGEKEREETPEGERLFGGHEAPAAESEPSGPDLAQLIWDRWEQTFPDKNPGGLTGPRRTQLGKALKAVNDDLDACYRAIAGFASYLERPTTKRRDVEISRVFATNIHDQKNLTDKIYGWAKDAPSGVTAAVYLSDYERGEIRHRKAAITEMYVRQAQDDESSPFYTQGHQAIDWLRDKYGIEHDADPEGRIVYTEPTKKPGDR